MATLIVPSEYGYVILTTLTMPLLSFIHGIHGSSLRKAAGIYPPQLYATPEQCSKETNPSTHAICYKYNCVQRVHANFMENMPQILVTMLLSGLKWPMLTTGLGLTWLGFRVVYAVGYIYGTAKHGNGREWGVLFYAAQGGLWLLCGKLAWGLITTGEF